MNGPTQIGPIHLFSKRSLNLSRQIKIDHPENIFFILESYNLPRYQVAPQNNGDEHPLPKNDWTGEDMMALVHAIIADLNFTGPNRRDGHLSEGLTF